MHWNFTGTMVNNQNFFINPDIRKAFTLPPEFYTNIEIFEHTKSSLFQNNWTYLGELFSCQADHNLRPFLFMPGLLDDQILAIRGNSQKWKTFSNICTHRSSQLVSNPCQKKYITCPYHGRRFTLDGKFRTMPGFEDTLGFPAASDNLHPIPLGIWENFAFINSNPDKISFSEWIDPIKARMSFYPFASLQKHEEKIYDIQAHWALYCDNYLEGFHIPFVHPALNQVLSVSDYGVELYDNLVLQTGIADPGEPTIQIPNSHPDAHKNMYAYYWWLFPNLMINFYPWGISLNEVIPISPRHTQVRYTYFLLSGHSSEEITQTNIHKTELEDEEIVEKVQKGIESKYAVSGRFSPKYELGVHHFQRILADWLMQNQKIST